MARGKLYNEEKVLYFASQPQGLHVSIREEDDTDLSALVQIAKDDGYIERVADDDSGLYYQTTQAGEIRLLELQIAWRKARRKSTAGHEARLAEMKEKGDE